MTTSVREKPLNAERNLNRQELIARALEGVEKIKVSYHDEALL